MNQLRNSFAILVNHFGVFSPFSLGLNSAVDFGVEVEGPDPETHGLAGFGGLLHNVRNKPWVLNVLL